MIKQKPVKRKLTAVSLSFRGRTIQAFVPCEVVWEKGKEVTRCPPHIVEGMLQQIGCTGRGQTYSMG